MAAVGDCFAAGGPGYRNGIDQYRHCSRALGCIRMDGATASTGGNAVTVIAGVDVVCGKGEEVKDCQIVRHESSGGSDRESIFLTIQVSGLTISQFPNSKISQ